MPTVLIPNAHKYELWNAVLGSAVTLKARFFTSSLTLDIDNDRDVADLGNEIASSSGTPGYTTGAGNGLTVSNNTVTQDDTNDRAVFDCDDLALGNHASAPTDVRSWAIVKNEALDADAVIYFMGNNGVTHDLQGGDLTVEFNASDGVGYW